MSRTLISAGIIFALYGGATAANADQPTTSSDQELHGGPGMLQEVVVTAQRREQSLEDVPYSVSVVNAAQLANTGTEDIASLTNQVPGLSMYNLGARRSSAETPIIRGVNASAGGNGFRTLEQSPVGMYVGNAPVDGYLQFDDVERIEVLRGPQGTLYGAGALGGALRIIPNAPEIGRSSGNVEASVGAVAHSSGAAYTMSGLINVPVGDTLAFRASAKYAYEPGFIDVYGLIRRPGAPISGVPVLQDPADPVNSPGFFSGQEDWNYQKTLTGRASLLWKPVESFSAQLGFLYTDARGNGGPVTNPDFGGGAYPIDPRITFPGGGDYKDFSISEEPWSHTTDLTSLDLSWDVGFATLSGTSSYLKTSGSALYDNTLGILAFPGTYPYYAGVPTNPRFVNPWLFDDSAQTFTQEVRLVSATGPDKKLDYVAGLFYQDKHNDGNWTISNPGSPQRAVAQGCTAPYFYGASFPNCLLDVGPNGLTYYQDDTQHFSDRSVFGELTWHFLTHGQITFGGRRTYQSFTDAQNFFSYTFGTLIGAVPQGAPTTKNTWKINPSYEYSSGHHVYALWSQGFRRGGANAVPFTGPYAEKSPLLKTYAADSTNNYEVGLKGHFASGLAYTFSIFDVYWDKPQVSGTTPVGNIAVWNASKARSTGAEFDLTTSLLLPGLSGTVGGAYVDARFTEDYFIPADSYGDIYGKAGQQLPGTPKLSAVATINYQHEITPGYDLTLSLNDTYRTGMLLSTFPTENVPPQQNAAMNLVNLSAAVLHAPWHLGAYLTNLTDTRVVQGSPFAPPADAIGHGYPINHPREVDLRLGYSF
jgi:outer membrane receptor protein involved in Fe transport